MYIFISQTNNRIYFNPFTEEQGLRIIKGRKGAKVMRNEMMHASDQSLNQWLVYAYKTKKPEN